MSARHVAITAVVAGLVVVVGAAVVLLVRAVVSGGEEPTMVAVTYEVRDGQPGVDVEATVTAIDGPLPDDLEVGETEYDARYLGADEADARQGAAGSRRTAIEIDRVADNRATVSYQVRPRPDGSHVVVLGSPLEGTRPSTVEVQAVTPEPSSCLVADHPHLPEGGEFWVADCSSSTSPSAQRRMEERESGASQDWVPAWVRLRF